MLLAGLSVVSVVSVNTSNTVHRPTFRYSKRGWDNIVASPLEVIHTDHGVIDCFAVVRFAFQELRVRGALL